MIRKCEVHGCENPKSNSNVNMHYGAHAICQECLDKAIAYYISETNSTDNFRGIYY